jgi:ornithine carbamoyltransferase
MNLLRVLDLDRPSLDGILECAAANKRDPERLRGALERQAMVALFARPSTRTRVAFAAAAHGLGLLPIVLEIDDLQLGRGEELADTARSLSSYVALIAARLQAHAELEQLAAAAHVPVVNVLSDRHHPCEAIASLFTLREHFGRLDGLRIAYVGDGGNVAHSLIEGGALAGCCVSVASPEGYRPDAAIVGDGARIAATNGGEVLVGDDPWVAISGADAVFTDTWISMGDEDEAAARRRQLAPYRVDEDLMRSAAREAVFVHCLPARRGEEVTSEVIDGPRSLVWQQVANHLPVAQAIIWTVVRAPGEST